MLLLQIFNEVDRLRKLLVISHGSRSLVLLAEGPRRRDKGIRLLYTTTSVLPAIHLAEVQESWDYRTKDVKSEDFTDDLRTDLLDTMPNVA